MEVVEPPSDESSVESEEEEDLVNIRTLAPNGRDASYEELMLWANLEDELGLTAVHRAALDGRSDILVELSALGGVDMDRKDGRFHNHALHWVLNRGWVHLLNLFPDQCFLERNKLGWTCAHIAAECGNAEVMFLLIGKGIEIDSRDKTGNTPLHLAAFRGSLQVTDVLLNNGVDVNSVNDMGQTPLHLAAGPNLSDVCPLWRFWTITNGYFKDGNSHLEVVKKLLDHRAIVDARDVLKQTPLHKAAASGNHEVVIYLRERGANLKSSDIHRKSPLHIAVSSRKLPIWVCQKRNKKGEEFAVDNLYPMHLHYRPLHDKLKTVSNLLALGAESTALDSRGQTPMHLACMRSSHTVVHLLIKHGTSLHVNNSECKSTLLLAVKYGKADTVSKLLSPPNKPLIEFRDLKLKTPIFYAVKNNHPFIINELLTAGCSCEVTDKKLRSIIHFAVRTGDLSLVEYILKLGVSLHLQNSQGKAPIHYAVKYGYHSIVRFLLGNGALVDHGDRQASTPLHIAAKYDRVREAQILLSFHAKVNMLNAIGQTPLHIAVECKNVEMVQLLLKNDATVYIMDHNSRTPLHCAVINNQYEITKYLLNEGANIDSTDGKIRPPIQLAVIYGYTELVRLLVERQCRLDDSDPLGLTPIHYAVKLGRLGALDYLIWGGADKLVLDDQMNTLLHIAVIEEHLPVVYKLLLSGGIDIEKKNIYKETALHIAAYNQNKNVMMALINNGANIEEPDSGGRRVIHVAATFSFEMIELLLDRGASVNATDDVKWTPLHYAVDKGRRADLVGLLLARGASPNAFDRKGVTPLHLAARNSDEPVVNVLLGEPAVMASINAVDFSGKTALHMASFTGSWKVVERLLSVRADISMKDKKKRTALHWAAKGCKTENVKILLEWGANYHSLDELGMTALHIAVSKGSLETVELLLEKTANMDIPDSEGRTALYLALKCQQHEIAKMLIDKEALLFSCSKSQSDIEDDFNS